MPDLLVRAARIVPLPGTPSVSSEPVDVLVRDGVVTEIGPGLAAPGVEVLDADGAWVLPGLWDAHVHLTQWAKQLVRIDTSGARSASEAVELVREHVAGLPNDGSLVQGFGHRSVTWPDAPSTEALDAVAAGHPIVLISGDAHHGWMSSDALARLGLESADGVVHEAPWFEAFARFDDVFGVDPRVEEAVHQAVRDANALGVVGVVDLEFGMTPEVWRRRVTGPPGRLRVRCGVYPDRLDEVVAEGLRTGDVVEGLVRQGPLKIISDGSLNTRTAFCCTPYADAPGRGVLNYPPEQVAELLRRASEHGLDVAVHAIGDAAVAHAIDAFESTGARGSIEHAQLVQWADIPRMARAGVVASVQPAHLLDDRDVTGICWPDRSERTFALRTMLDAGVRLALGSDAPVAPLDPWLAAAAAVHRSGDDREAFHSEQAISVAEALAASTDGQRVAVGARGDLVLVGVDPLAAGSAAAQADSLRRMPVHATVVDGRVVHRG